MESELCIAVTGSKTILKWCFGSLAWQILINVKLIQLWKVLKVGGIFFHPWCFGQVTMYADILETITDMIFCCRSPLFVLIYLGWRLSYSSMHWLLVSVRYSTRSQSVPLFRTRVLHFENPRFTEPRRQPSSNKCMTELKDAEAEHSLCAEARWVY